ncbi:MAG: TIGR01244 family sulfur transferase [Pseudomonadota bacterium]
MDIRTLTPAISVGPQIAEADAQALADAGFKTLINNRPDEEVALTGGPDSATMEAAAKSAGLAYHYLPIPGAGFGPEHVTAMRDIIEGADAPVYAYCRSGTRSSNVWALSQAGSVEVEELMNAGAQAGYDFSGLRSLLGQRIG